MCRAAATDGAWEDGRTMNLYDRLPDADDPDETYSRFVEWAGERGLTLYPHQEEAIIELLAGANVILATPTGSGKSMVATAAHFAALAGDRMQLESGIAHPAQIGGGDAEFGRDLVDHGSGTAGIPGGRCGSPHRREFPGGPCAIACEGQGRAH